MRAVVLHAVGGEEQLVPGELADPSPGEGEVLVRVRAASVCGRDLIDRRGGFPAIKLPIVLGHEFAGEIVALGAGGGAGGLSPGDRVVNLHRPFCAACSRCRAGDLLLCERAFQSFGHTIDGGYAEFVVAHHRALVRLPSSISFEAGSTLMCTAGVALRALRGRADVQLGERVLITGASGGVGVMAIQIARTMGARVIAVTSSPAKADALRSLGAEVIVARPDGRFASEVLRRTDGVDVALELTGTATFVEAMKSLRRGGRLALLGNINADKIPMSLGPIILSGTSIIGSASCTARDLEDVIALVERGAITPTIDRTLPLEGAADAHRILAARGAVGRIVLLP